MDIKIFLYLDLLIPIRLVMSKDMDILIKNIVTELYSISVPVINSIIFNAIRIYVSIKSAPLHKIYNSL